MEPQNVNNALYTSSSLNASGRSSFRKLFALISFTPTESISEAVTFSRVVIVAQLMRRPPDAPLTPALVFTSLPRASQIRFVLVFMASFGSVAVGACLLVLSDSNQQLATVKHLNIHLLEDICHNISTLGVFSTHSGYNGDQLSCPHGHKERLA
jgi:hypothetical protein